MTLILEQKRDLSSRTPSSFLLMENVIENKDHFLPTKLDDWRKIIMMDDFSQLKTKLSLSDDMGSFTIKYNGQSAVCGSIGFAIMCQSEHCMNLIPIKPGNYEAKNQNDPCAAHIAFATGWKPGIKYILQKNILNPKSYDKFHKSPIAYIADRNDLEALECVIKYAEITTNRSKCIFDDVFIPKTGSVGFITYCASLGRSQLIDYCDYAFTKKVMNVQSVDKAIEIWEKIDQPLPVLLQKLKINRDIARKIRDLTMFLPKFAQSSFAPATTNGSIDVKVIIHDIELLGATVKEYRQYSMAPLSLEEYDYENDKNILVNFPLYLTTNYQIAYSFTPHLVLQKYFKTFFSDYWVLDDEYLIPKTKTNDDKEVWNGFGIVLAHIGYSGCYCKFPNQLHPFIYTALNKNCLQKLGSMADEEIESCLRDLKPKHVNQARRELVNAFHRDNMNMKKYFENDIRNEWDKLIQAFYPYIRLIQEGFETLKIYGYDCLQMTDLKSFMTFKSVIQDLSLPSIRLWYEGCLFHNDDIFNNKSLQITQKMKFNYLVDSQYINSHKVFHEFKEGFFDWCKANSNLAVDFIVAMCGVNAFLPFENNHLVFTLIYDPRVFSYPRPMIITPQLQAVLWVVPKEEIFEVYTRVAQQALEGNITYEIPEIIDARYVEIKL